MTRKNKEPIMKTEKSSEKDTAIVYRKDGKTPDLRYKSSRDFVSSQQLEININKSKESEKTDLSYAGFREHALSQQIGNIMNAPAQIKPAGKKPVWKIVGTS